MNTLKDGDKCPHCKYGYMEYKRGRFGEFLGCNEFPYCANKQDIKIKDEDDELPKDRAVDKYF